MRDGRKTTAALGSILLCASAATLAACDVSAKAAGSEPGGSIVEAGAADGAGEPAAARAAGRASGRHAVMDAVALGRSAVALELTVPAGWRAQSAVRWDNVNGQCSRDIASPMFRLTSTDGTASIEQFPGFLVTTSEQAIRGRGSMPGDFCVLAMADSGQAFAANIAIPFLRPQSRILGMRAIPLDAAVTAITQRVQQAAAGGAMRVEPYEIEVLLANGDGTREKIVLGGVILLGRQMMQGVPPVVINQNNVAYAVRAMPDRMAEVEGLARQVRASIRPNPQWVAAVGSIQNRLTRPVFPRQPSGVPNDMGRFADRGGAGGYGTGGGAPGGTGATGGVNSDRAQQQRIDGMYEQERCADGRVVSIHVGC